MLATLLIAATEATETGGEHGGSAEAPNPILPATNEVIWGAISFVLLLLIMYKYAYPAIQKTMDARANRIRENIDEAEKSKAEASSLLEEYKGQLAEARSESSRIIEEARQTAEQLRKDLIAKAEADAAELRQRSKEEIEAAKKRIMADLRTEVSDLAIDLAEKVVERNLDDKTNAALIDSYIKELESQSK